MNFISAFLLSILRVIYGFVGNYAWAVVLFTLLIRLVLMPLDVKSKSSMGRMQAIQPQLTALQKKYANDKEKLNQKTSELYRKEKINPLSGCLPMLIQMPILFCMFTAMRVLSNEETVQMLLKLKEGVRLEELLQGWFWVKNVFQPDSFMSTIIPIVGDGLTAIQPVANTVLTAENLDAARTFLSSPEYTALAQQWGAAGEFLYRGKMLIWDIAVPLQVNGFFILPILAGVCQFFASKLMNAGQAQTADPNSQQASTNKMMQWFFPLFSIFICATSTAAFSLYWVFVTLIQIVQQALISMYFKKKDANKPEEAQQS
jgi:YidC/Oxa1 family membrane protein insertase